MTMQRHLSWFLSVMIRPFVYYDLMLTLLCLGEDNYVLDLNVSSIK